jgi:hypothetical protein
MSKGRSKPSTRTGSILIAASLLWLAPGLARATPDTGLEHPALAPQTAEALEPQTAEAGEPFSGTPLPRFTVGWYCPAPDADPLHEAIGFGLGVLLIWGVAARRKARADREGQRA